MDIHLESGWTRALAAEFSAPYFASLRDFVDRAYAAGPVYPPSHLIFNAFRLCPLEAVKVVIVGQDPYHGAGQANGLSFSVNDGVALPPSLKNIFREVAADTGVTPLSSGNLERWAKQGVLLLNTTLTVGAGKAQSHCKRGWERFTDAALAAVSRVREHLVFMLWGQHARAKAALLDRGRHLVLEAAHPSPLTFGKFAGCRHFSAANHYLQQHKMAPIDWK
ncbi:MAG: uracil-DNA glycosylase [Deltaproteobacteria bacterium]|nr:uracil-DNA glycosylase [Deltaproteobacteria bacterium]